MLNDLTSQRAVTPSTALSGKQQRLWEPPVCALRRYCHQLLLLPHTDPTVSRQPFVQFPPLQCTVWPEVAYNSITLFLTSIRSIELLEGVIIAEN